MNTDDITDPSDWKKTRAPYMQPIEATLTCHICKEMMTAPVLTACCHTFCSMCIRSALNTESKCPVCRAEIQSSGLRKNDIVEVLIDLYEGSRSRLIKLARLNEKVEKNSGTLTRPRKRSRTENTEVLIDDKTDGTDASEGEEDQDDDDGDIQIERIESATPEKKKRKVAENSEMGECPICNRHMKISEIQSTHITQCLGSQNDVEPSSFFKKRESKSDMTKKIGSIAYTLYNGQELKQYMKSMGIPTTGTRQQLQDRYREWVTLWNANADAKAPVSKRELLDRLRRWENAMERSKRKKNLDVDAEDWTKTHKDAFAKLIASAKNKT